jgi:SOS-response transcriptional repressor LexA
VFEAVIDLTARHGISPTHREIASRVHLSHQRVTDHLAALARMMLIAYDPAAHRGIRILPREALPNGKADRERINGTVT